ncbi:vacuolar transporter chaperone, partial [Lunasporangiospora selenospora]
MKFGKQLATNRAPHWRYHFVDYDRLKAHLKSKSQDSQFSNEDEATFEKMLLTELDKVASFQELKLGEIQRRTEHCEQMIQRHQSSTSGSDSGASSPRSPSSTSSIEHSRLTLASFVATESEINKVTQDLQDLAHFQRLNYTAFLKILKKHDKHSGHALRAKFINTHLTNQPFHKQSLTPFVRRLSNLYNTVRTGTTSAANIAKAGSTESSEDETLMDQQGYIPGKASFWVHPDNIMDLKMLILKYLPLIVYEPTPGSAPPNRSQDAAESNLACDTPVSTVYLDNADLDLYLAHVEHQDRTETVRLRWFGSDNRHVWVEHQQKQLNKGKGPATSPSASSSVASMPHTTTTKHRFQIKSKNIPKLIEGNASLTKIIEAVRCTGQKSEQEINQFEERTRIVQSRIKKRHLQPVTQVFFNRTTFQVPGDSRVRITIDTDVSMIREKPVIPSTIYERPWSPSNRLQAENYSFPQANNQDIVRFPYAVMQIRTMTEPHDEAPAWVEYISQSHLVEMIPNFAKDQHAIATLYESRVGLLPFWLSDMDRDIRKMAVHSGYLRQSATPQDSDSSKAGSDDTLGSNDSTPATSISDVEPALKTTSSRRGKTVEEITVQRALLTGENTPSVSAGESDFFKKSGSKSSSSHPHPHHPHHHQPNEPPAKETFVTPVPLNRTASSSLTALAKKPVRPM